MLISVGTISESSISCTCYLADLRSARIYTVLLITLSLVYFTTKLSWTDVDKLYTGNETYCIQAKFNHFTNRQSLAALR